MQGNNSNCVDNVPCSDEDGHLPRQVFRKLLRVDLGFARLELTCSTDPTRCLMMLPRARTHTLLIYACPHARLDSDRADRNSPEHQLEGFIERTAVLAHVTFCKPDHAFNKLLYDFRCVPEPGMYFVLTIPKDAQAKTRVHPMHHVFVLLVAHLHLYFQHTSLSLASPSRV
jgi:hypothetical protein